MNKAYKILFCILIALSFSYVKAECTSDEINKLKKEADKIEVTYSHIDEGVENEEGINYNLFNVTIKNISDDLYITLLNNEIKLIPENNLIEEQFISGEWDLDIYATKCETKIDTIKMKLPKFNIYSLDPLCEGIDGNDFSLCGKYYEYDVGYDDFKKRVENYRNEHRITTKKEDKIEEKNTNKIQDLLKKINIENIMKHKKTIIITICSITLLLISILAINKRKKRGVLK